MKVRGVYKFWTVSVTVCNKGIKVKDFTKQECHRGWVRAESCDILLIILYGDRIKIRLPTSMQPSGQVEANILINTIKIPITI